MSLPSENAAEIEQTQAADSLSRSRLKLDLITSYALSAARVGSNVAIFAILYRYTNERYAATYAVIRSMLMLLTYVFGGFNPVMQRLLASPILSDALAARNKECEVAPNVYAPKQLDYASSHVLRHPLSINAIVYANAMFVICPLVIAAYFAVNYYGDHFSSLHDVAISRPWAANAFAATFGLGVLFRLIAEPASSILQDQMQLWLDNVLQICGEVCFVLFSFVLIWSQWSINWERNFLAISTAFVVSSALAMFLRLVAARVRLEFDLRSLICIRPRLQIWIIINSATISLGQFADFLYAPANVLLINTFIHPSAVARYAPALQIDAGLLLLVGAVSSVMLPRAMAAWARGERELLRDAYLRSTLACLFVLACAAIFVGLFIEPILTLWLGTVPPEAPMITRLVLIHTVIGGTAGVGRSVLLGMGRFKAYTVSALLGGIANVSLALLFVLVFDLGLRGIVLATVISVTVRCAVWMPWYILRALRKSSQQSGSSLRSDAGV